MRNVSSWNIPAETCQGPFVCPVPREGLEKILLSSRSSLLTESYGMLTRHYTYIRCDASHTLTHVQFTVCPLSRDAAVVQRDMSGFPLPLVSPSLSVDEPSATVRRAVASSGRASPKRNVSHKLPVIRHTVAWPGSRWAQPTIMSRLHHVTTRGVTHLCKCPRRWRQRS